MPTRESLRGLVRAAVATERSLILGLGGYAMEVAGGTLVLHERIPVPRFNFVETQAISPERQAAFFERTLDQYFQRAIRPRFRVPLPSSGPVERTLRALGFTPLREPLELLGRPPGRPAGKGATPFGFRSDAQVPSSALVPFWVSPREQPELESALEILRHHPNPKERFSPVIATDPDRAIAAGLVYSRGEGAFLFGVSTVPAARRQGAATALVRWILSQPAVRKEPFAGILSESRGLSQGLRRLGFSPWARWRVFELAADAQLSVPSAPSSTGPLWRPPRIARPGGRPDRTSAQP